MTDAAEPHHSASNHHGEGKDDAVGGIDWDARYSSADQLWSGEPNCVLVEVASTLRPRRVLDVGCGEGADAVWLATQGWDVTALDVSEVAIDRARGRAADADVTVSWIVAGLEDARIPPSSFDLVSAQYPVLKRTPDATAEHILLDAVARGGTLLIVHHANFRADDEVHHDFDPADYVGPWDVVPLLDDGWRVLLDEVRPRSLTAGAGAGHSEDYVLVAQKI